MSGYEVGYGKPPMHTRFKKGVCANPRGRGKRRPLEAEKILEEVLMAEMDYKEGGKMRRAPRLEVAIRTLAAKAVKGDVPAPSSFYCAFTPRITATPVPIVNSIPLA
jgi:Family of unknown function (DUF5681)